MPKNTPESALSTFKVKGYDKVSGCFGFVPSVFYFETDLDGPLVILLTSFINNLLIRS